MNRLKLKDSRRAVTLVEVMISFMIFGIVLVLGYTMLNRTFMSLERQRQSLDTLHEARNFLMVIERDLREMTEVDELDTIFKSSLFDEENALLYKISMTIPKRDGSGFERVTYTYEGPDKYGEGSQMKTITRQVDGGAKRQLITKQMNYLKIWGTDGTIFRNRYPEESMADYRNYLRPHYYHPSNPSPNGLRDLKKVKGVEVQLSMHEMFDSDRKPIKQRTFVTRIYSRILNAKFD
ncbi:MAG: prepilin-type N-terminal cleavage/methylation domain-containing protein [Candidatus Riflebacteria bacterium]|nr:prepilin-type N-terminal cleavage/methylation domain-containing protein [Candidatus Riflebacteria bacterium]